MLGTAAESRAPCKQSRQAGVAVAAPAQVDVYRVMAFRPCVRPRLEAWKRYFVVLRSSRANMLVIPLYLIGYRD